MALIFLGFKLLHFRPRPSRQPSANKSSFRFRYFSFRPRRRSSQTKAQEDPSATAATFNSIDWNKSRSSSQLSLAPSLSPLSSPPSPKNKMAEMVFSPMLIPSSDDTPVAEPHQLAAYMNMTARFQFFRTPTTNPREKFMNPTPIDNPFRRKAVIDFLTTRYMGPPNRCRLLSVAESLDLIFSEADERELATRSDLWCPVRFGQTRTKLADGRIILIGGRHYDCHRDMHGVTYNDVIVINPSEHQNGCVRDEPLFPPQPQEENIKIYGYSEGRFPPVYGHTATYISTGVEEFIIIVGGCGANRSSPRREETMIHYLDLQSYSINYARPHGASDWPPAVDPGNTRTHTKTAVRAKWTGDEADIVIEFEGGQIGGFALSIPGFFWARQRSRGFVKRSPRDFTDEYSLAELGLEVEMPKFGTVGVERDDHRDGGMNRGREGRKGRKYHRNE
ncbi:hypothetical protein B0H66DRAFT_640695 [Apodospora peruviana]|uniref:Uncharacterized protein n=1 Tax=Apodospora peruviana TaxID=516989 RepID=A0AAE0M1M1_9PEZI|nr:hypothetical protein B0H66DRAFT_640695 [Apodospora peruviana]